MKFDFQKIKMLTLKNIIIIFVLFALSYVAVCIYIASVLTIAEKSPITYDKSKIGNGVDVKFTTSDNLNLSGWYFQGNNGKAIMFVHGAGNQNRANVGYGTPAIAKYFLQKGYSILLFDLRGTGESEKARISFGEYESRDVTAAFNFLKTKGYKEQSIGMIGNSLGAISIIMAGDKVKDAGAIVLDSPATIVKPIVAKLMRDDHNVPSFLNPGIFLAAKLLFNIDADKVRPIDKISELYDTPLLFLHGQNDDLIPPIESTQLAAKVRNGKSIVFLKGKHTQTYSTDPNLYLTSVSDFFMTNLK